MISNEDYIKKFITNNDDVPVPFMLTKGASDISCLWLPNASLILKMAVIAAPAVPTESYRSTTEVVPDAGAGCTRTFANGDPSMCDPFANTDTLYMPAKVEANWPKYPASSKYTKPGLL